MSRIILYLFYDYWVCNIQSAENSYVYRIQINDRNIHYIVSISSYVTLYALLFNPANYSRNMNLCQGSRRILQRYRQPLFGLNRTEGLSSTPVASARENENFTFDREGRVADTLEKERKKYEEYVETIGDSRFSDRDLNQREVEYVASQAEWKHVQRIIDSCAPRLIPGRYQIRPD